MGRRDRTLDRCGPELVHGAVDAFLLQRRHRLAYVPGDVPLWPGLTGGQCIDILTYAQGSGSTPHRDDLIERFELDPTKRTREYSKGNRQKVALVAAMSADVDLLVLDEPTAGLDPLMEQVFQDVVRERRNAGCTVLLSSHILGEVEALADRVTIIRAGRTVKTGSLAELRRDTRVAVHALTEAEPSFELHTSTLSSVETGRADGYVNTSFTVDPIELDAAIGELHRVGIHTLTVTPPSLDELFLQSYSSSPTGARHTEGEGQTGRRTAGQRYQGVGR